MRKLLLLFCFTAALLLFVSGCESTNDDSSDFTDSAVELGEKFIKELYNVDDPDVDYDSMSVESLLDAQNEFSSYFTEKEFEELATKRIFLMPLEAASKQHSTITVKHVTFKKDNGEKAKSDAIDFNHSFTLVFTDSEGNQISETEITGQMTVVDTENGLKIDRYFDTEIPSEMLFP